MHVEGCYHDKLRQLSSGAARSEASTMDGGPRAPLEGKTQRRPITGPTRGGSTRNDGNTMAKGVAAMAPQRRSRKEREVEQREEKCEGGGRNGPTE